MQYSMFGEHHVNSAVLKGAREGRPYNDTAVDSCIGIYRVIVGASLAGALQFPHDGLRIPPLWIIISIQRHQRETGTRLSYGVFVCVPVPAPYMPLKLEQRVSL